MKNKKEAEMRVVVFMIAILAAVSIAVASSYPATTGMAAADLQNLDYAFGHLDEVKLLYNDKLSAIPGFVRALFGNEKMNVEIIRADGSSKRISVETVEGKIEVISNKPFESYTLDVKVQESAINRIISADNAVLMLKEALDKGEITYEALNFGTGIKLAISRFLLMVLGWFR